MKTKVNERLVGIAQKDQEIAQEKLNALCDKYKMKHILLSHGKSDWRELCYRMIGIVPMEKKSTGRPSTKEEYKEQQDYFFAYMDIVDELPFIDYNGNEIIKETSLDEKIELYTRKSKPEDRKTVFTGKEFKGIDKLKNSWKNFGRKRLEELRIEELKRREIEDY